MLSYTYVNIIDGHFWVLGSPIYIWSFDLYAIVKCIKFPSQIYFSTIFTLLATAATITSVLKIDATTIWTRLKFNAWKKILSSYSRNWLQAFLSATTIQVVESS